MLLAPWTRRLRIKTDRVHEQICSCVPKDEVLSDLRLKRLVGQQLKAVVEPDRHRMQRRRDIRGYAKRT